MKWIVALLAGAVVGVAAEPGQNPGSSTNADNTGRNADQSMTAQDQGESPGDRELTSRIRSSLVENDALSMSAKNVKVITRDGKVTLRGPVPSDRERQAIGMAAESVAGKANVTNQLEVKATQSSP